MTAHDHPVTVGHAVILAQQRTIELRWIVCINSMWVDKTTNTQESGAYSNQPILKTTMTIRKNLHFVCRLHAGEWAIIKSRSSSSTKEAGAAAGSSGHKRRRYLLAAHLGSPSHAAGAATGAAAQRWERLGRAHVPRGLGHLELLGMLVGVLLLDVSGRLLVLVHPLAVGKVLQVVLFNVLKKRKCVLCSSKLGNCYVKRQLWIFIMELY